MSNCSSRVEMEADVYRRLQRVLKKESNLSNDEIRRIAKADTKIIVDKAIAASKVEEFADEVDAASSLTGAVQELNANKPKYDKANIDVVDVNNGKVYYKYVTARVKQGKTYSTKPEGITLEQKSAKEIVSKYENVNNVVVITKTKQEVQLTKDLQAAMDKHIANPSIETAEAVKRLEVALGYRNNKDELLVSYKPRESYGSGPITPHTFEDTYTDSDGTMKSATKINELMIELDKSNQGVNFDKGHSEELTTVINKIKTMVKDLNDVKVQIRKADLKDVVEAHGRYHPSSNTVEINVDKEGPLVEARNKFAMTNQEAFVHEAIHAIVDFIFDKGNQIVSNDTRVISLTADLKKLYFKAKKKTTFKDLVPEGENTPSARLAAKDKWDYIFNNKDGHGFAEFIAGIMTNKMMQEAMSKINSMSTKEEFKDESFVDGLKRRFMNLLERITGFTTNKRTNEITKDGIELVWKLVAAHNTAVEKSAINRAIKGFEDVSDKVQEGLDLADETVKSITDPFIGAFDKIEKSAKKNIDKGVMEPEALIDEVAKLNAKLQKLVAKHQSTKDKTKNNSSNNAIAFIKDLTGFIGDVIVILRALPTIYKLRELTKDLKRSRSMMELVAKRSNELMEAIGLTQEGMIRSFVNDFIDHKGIYNAITDAILELTYKVDEARQSMYEGTLSDIYSAYGDLQIGNNIMHREDNEALTAVIMRTDIQSLGLELKDLVELIKDPKALDTLIANREKQLTPGQLLDANSLANYMVTGEGLPTNAHNIAMNFGRDKERDLSIKEEDPIVLAIDELVTLLALRKTPKKYKNAFIAFIQGDNYDEYSNSLWGKAKKQIGFDNKKKMSKEAYIKNAKNGTEMFLQRARGLQQASKREMIANPHNIIKGYMKDTYNNDYSIEYHPMEDKAKFEKEGYTFIRVAAKLPGQTKEYGLFKSNSPAVKRVNGALGLQDAKVRGLTLDDITQRESDSSEKPWPMEKRKQYKKVLLARLKKEYAQGKTNMVPMFDVIGNIVNFRVTMSIADKEEFLDLETRGTENMARAWSKMGTVDKTAEHNRHVVDLLYKDFVDNYNESSKYKYISIKPKKLEDMPVLDTTGMSYTAAKKATKAYNEEVERQRFWARLPKDTKEYIKETFGTKEIILKKELLTVAFGEDNFSLAQSKLLQGTSELTKARVRIIEGYWQDIMQIAKSNIVIKTPDVLIGNLISNFKLLLYQGIHPVKGTKLVITGAKELKRYESDKRELGKLVRDKLGGKKGLENRIKELEKEIAENTVAPLIEAGMYQSVVEDVGTAGTLNRTAAMFDTKVDKYVTNGTVNTAVQYLFLTQKTKPYQQLLKATQVSDFYFRYAQYYAEIDKGVSKSGIRKFNGMWEYTDKSKAIKNGITAETIFKNIEAKAMRNAIDNFINYEVPLTKMIRYGDSMGPFFFVKYFTKIQRVVKKLAKEHPGRLALDIAVQQFITGDTADVLDASFIDKELSTYNPLNVGDRIGEVIYPSGMGLLLGK